MRSRDFRSDYSPARQAAALEARQSRLNRYSRFVRVARVALPIGALLVLATIFVVERERTGLRDLLTAEELAKLSAGLKLDQPRFAGSTQDGEPFLLRADAATPDGAMPKEVGLEGPSGTLTMNDGRVVEARADGGIMYRRSERLVLKGDVEITTSDGYRFESRVLQLDLDKKTAMAPERVRGTGPQGSIEADSMRIDNAEAGGAGATLHFTGRVQLLFRPGASE